MNIKRLIICIIAVFVAVSVTDILIHGIWLSPVYGATKHLWRPEDEMGSGKFMAWLHLGHLLVAATVSVLWAAGFAEKATMSCAIKYGLTLGLLMQAHTL